MIDVADSNDRVEKEVLDAIRDTVLVCRHLVDHPDDVSVEVRSSGYVVIVTLRTHEGDVGQVIGRNAFIIGSFRSLVSAIAGKHHIQCILDFVTESDLRKSGNRASGNNRLRN